MIPCDIKKQAGWLPSGNVLPFAEHGPFSSLIYQPKTMAIFHPGQKDSCSVQRQRQLAMIEATVFVLTPLERIEGIDVILFYFVLVGFYYFFPVFSIFLVVYPSRSIIVSIHYSFSFLRVSKTWAPGLLLR